MGHFSPSRETNTRKLQLICWRTRGIVNVEKFQMVQNFLTGLRNHCFEQQKENQLVVTEKNNKPNQKLTKIVVAGSVFN